LRPLWPIDETRYVSVAWEMWQRGDFLVPHLNGRPYPHKPPLLFWLIYLGWGVLGVNEWWPRLVPSIFGLASVFLTAKLAKMLWPDKKDVALMSSFVLMGFFVWAAFCTVVMFDLILSFFALVTIIGGVYIIREERVRGILLMGVGIGLGILSKGPVIFVHALPVLLLYPWWERKGDQIGIRSTAKYFCLAIMLGVGISLLWVVPAAIRGGEGYRSAILWGQTVHRVASSFAHKRPWWWYLPWLPLLTCPWILFLPSWRGFFHNTTGGTNTGFRFCISWILPSLIVFSLVSGKQIYYLLPMLPPVALLIAWSLSTQSSCERHAVLAFAFFMGLIGTVFVLSPIYLKGPRFHGMQTSGHAWGIILLGVAAALLVLRGRSVFKRVVAVFLATIILLCVGETITVRAIGPAYDLKEVASIIKTYEDQGRPIAHSGKYHGQFHFLGRLKRPFKIINDSQIDSWLKDHPQGRVIGYYRHLPESAPVRLLYSQPYRGRILVILGAQNQDKGMALHYVTAESSHACNTSTQLSYHTHYFLRRAAMNVSDIIKRYVTETPDSRIGSCGKGMDDSEIQVIDKNGNTLPQGEQGELCVRGTCVTLGYLNNPEATREAFDPKGWFHSGDIAYMDEDGYA